MNKIYNPGMKKKKLCHKVENCVRNFKPYKQFYYYYYLTLKISLITYFLLFFCGFTLSVSFSLSFPFTQSGQFSEGKHLQGFGPLLSVGAPDPRGRG